MRKSIKIVLICVSSTLVVLAAAIGFMYYHTCSTIQQNVDYPVKNGYKKLHGYEIYNIYSHVSEDLKVVDAKYKNTYRLDALPEEDILYCTPVNLWDPSGFYINEACDELILTDRFNIKQLKLFDDLIITDKAIISQLVVLRRNGALTDVDKETVFSDGEWLACARFEYDLPCELYWECYIDDSKDGKMYMIFMDGKTGDRYAVDVTDVLKDIIDDYLSKKQ